MKHWPLFIMLIMAALLFMIAPATTAAADVDVGHHGLTTDLTATTSTASWWIDDPGTWLDTYDDAQELQSATHVASGVTADRTVHHGLLTGAMCDAAQQHHGLTIWTTAENTDDTMDLRDSIYDGSTLDIEDDGYIHNEATHADLALIATSLDDTGATTGAHHRSGA